MLAAAPPETFFVGSAIFHYLGPSFAVLLFARISPPGVAWLRIASAAVIYAAWRRPWRGLSLLDAAGRRTLVGMGVVLAVMNICFYISIDRLPLGTVAAIEFLPVIGLAAVGTRTARNAFAVALAVGGVYLLTDVRIAGEPVGVASAFAHAALFALYIVLAHRVSQQPALGGIDGLAFAMLVALLVATPLGGWYAAPAFVVKRSTYALMVSLLPATATVVGIVVLAQIPSAIELAGVALVVGGVAVHRE